MVKRFFGLILIVSVFGWQACSPGRKLPTAAKDPLQQFVQDSLLGQPGLSPAQIGISLYDPATASYIYNYQGDKYFIPASNTKLFSLYTGLRYLGDSLGGYALQDHRYGPFCDPCR